MIVKKLTSAGLLKVSDLLEITDKLASGKNVILPTDTGYLIACDATNETAIQNVFDIKKRQNNNPIHICVGSVKQAHEAGKFNEIANKLLKAHCPGAISVIVPKQDWVSDLLVANTGNIGVRIPDSPCILQVCNELQKPITATSLNISTHAPLSDTQEILEVFGSKIDLMIETNRPFLSSSTIVRVIDDNVEILRQGPISKELIFNTI